MKFDLSERGFDLSALDIYVSDHLREGQRIYEGRSRVIVSRTEYERMRLELEKSESPRGGK